MRQRSWLSRCCSRFGRWSLPRPTDPKGSTSFAAGAVLEALLVGFLVGGIVQMAGSDRHFARVEFVGYLLRLRGHPADRLRLGVGGEVPGGRGRDRPRLPHHPGHGAAGEAGLGGFRSLTLVPGRPLPRPDEASVGGSWRSTASSPSPRPPARPSSLPPSSTRRRWPTCCRIRCDRLHRRHGLAGPGEVTSRRLATEAINVEPVGVLVVGAASELFPDAFPDATVWTRVRQRLRIRAACAAVRRTAVAAAHACQALGGTGEGPGHHNC